MSGWALGVICKWWITKIYFWNHYYTLLTNLNANLKKCLCWFVSWERERVQAGSGGGGAEKEGDRIWSRIQDLRCQHRAQWGAWTEEPWDHDLSRSQMLNQLSHPGTPDVEFKINKNKNNNNNNNKRLRKKIIKPNLRCPIFGLREIPCTSI